MSRKSSPKSQLTREDRLKAALKANMGRRKAQAKARSQSKSGAMPHNQAGKKPAEQKE